MNDYYVYVMYRPDGRPCYVGKGRGYRYCNMQRLYNPHLQRIIDASGGRIESRKWTTGLSETDAHTLEMRLIRIMGRGKMGLLANLTDGGDGQSGFIPSPETRKKRSIAMTGKKFPPRSDECRARQSASRKGKKAHPNTRAALLEASKRPKSEAHKRAISEGNIKSEKRKAYSQKMSVLMKGVPKTAAQIASNPMMQKGVPKSLRQRIRQSEAHRGVPLSPEHRAAIGMSHRGKKRSPEARARMSVAQRKACSHGDSDVRFVISKRGYPNRVCRACRRERNAKRAQVKL